MGKVRRDVYVPDPQRQRAYDALYAEYCTLHDYFGVTAGGQGNDVLHRLRRIRNQARSR
jgi:L-ribulokinase